MVQQQDFELEAEEELAVRHWLEGENLRLRGEILHSASVLGVRSNLLGSGSGSGVVKFSSFEAIRDGAQAYLLKDASEAEVLDTIRCGHLGESRLSRAIAQKVMTQFRKMAAATSGSATVAAEPQLTQADRVGQGVRLGATPPSTSHDSLTEKEARILNLLAHGLSKQADCRQSASRRAAAASSSASDRT